jgi:Flp pilus assembly protein TadB
MRKITILRKWIASKRRKVPDVEAKAPEGNFFSYKRKKRLEDAAAKKKPLSLQERVNILKKLNRKKPTRRDFQIKLKRAGISASPDTVHKMMYAATFIITVIAYIGYILYLVGTDTYDGGYAARIALLFFTIGTAVSYGITTIALRQIMELKVYNRKKEVEEVLADFLLLTSANVRAGMTIDKALWHAVRPRFGVLAREIEMVAKRTLSGDDLDSALYEFAESYDSVLLKRSVSLLVEGLNAGGEIAGLLNNIALNIQETQIIRKEMGSAVTTYAIFIQFATVFAAPFLFALAGELLKVVGKLSQVVDIDSGLMQQSGFAFSFGGGGGLVYSDFLIFAMVTLTATSVISSIIVSTIKKGDAREALTSVPGTLAFSISFFFLISYFLGKFLGGVV